MSRKAALIVAAILAAPLSSHAESNSDSEVFDIVHIDSEKLSLNDCKIDATIDFLKFSNNIQKIRDAWLNKDNSADYYYKYRRALLYDLFVSVFAQYITRYTYEYQHQDSIDKCKFAINLKTPDDFGALKVFPAASWEFDRSIAKKVVWANIEPQNFPKISINYKETPMLQSWAADGPKPDRQNDPSPAPANKDAECNQKFVRANTIFTISTVKYCKKNYTNSNAGRLAFQETGVCSKLLTQEKFLAIIKNTLAEMRKLVRLGGAKQACLLVDELADAIDRANSQ